MSVEVQTSRVMPASWADISDCVRYRYSLGRLWNNVSKPRMVAFGALNPSTADALIDDQTIRKEIAFAKQWGMDGLVKWNCYAWRETSPFAMFEASRTGRDIIGPRNSPDSILALIQSYQCEFVVVGWGTNSSKNYASRIASRGQEIVVTLKSAGLKIYCLGFNKDGSPEHPLYLPLNRQLQSFPKTSGENS